MDFDYIKEYAKKKYRLSVAHDAFMEGVRLGFQLASNRYLEYLSEFEKRRANNVIVINNNESGLTTMKAVEQTEMMEHCIRQMQKHPNRREGLEHFVFLQLLERCPESEYKRIVELYKYIDKTLYYESK